MVRHNNDIKSDSLPLALYAKHYTIMNNKKMIDKAMFISFSDLNLSYIIGFHMYVLKQLKSKENDIAGLINSHAKKDKEYVDLLVERDLYAETYKNHLMVNTFLMLYSHFEEWIYLIYKKYGKTIELKDNRGSISRYKPFLKNVFKMDLSKDKDWSLLIDAEEIRNCLLHANGRIDLVKNKAKIDSVIKRYKNTIHINKKLLFINQELLEKLSYSMQSIISKVELVT